MAAMGIHPCKVGRVKKKEQEDKELERQKAALDKGHLTAIASDEGTEQATSNVEGVHACLPGTRCSLRLCGELGEGGYLLTETQS